MSRTHRCRGRLLAPLAVLTLALSACGGTSATPEGPSTPGEDGGEAAAGDNTLRVALEVDLANTDNLQARITTDRLVLGSTVYEPLFGSDQDGEPAPALAREAVPSDDATSWTITLQEGVTFHNGKDFTADDVKANFEAYLDPANGSALAGDIANIDSVEVLSPTELEVTLKEPDAAFPATLTDTVFMGDMDAREEMGADAWAQSPVGTGPYQWSSRQVGDNITFERYDDYWRGEPPLDQVVFQVIPDAQVAAVALQAGDVDIVPNYLAVEALPDLRQDPDIELYSVESNTWYLTFINARKEYDDPLAFRTGVAHLFAMEDIVPEVIGEFGTYANQPIPPWQRGHDPDLEAFPFDPERGTELLTQAGYPPGSTLRWLVRVAPYNCDVATAVQSRVQEHGYNVDLQCAEGEVVEPETLEYEWDLLSTRNSGRATAGVFFKDRWRKSLAEAEDDYYTLQSDELEGVIDELLAETDPDRAEELGQRASNIIIREEVAAIGGYWSTSWWSARSRVEGLVLSPLGWNGFLMNEMTTVSIDE